MEAKEIVNLDLILLRFTVKELIYGIFFFFTFVIVRQVKIWITETNTLWFNRGWIQTHKETFTRHELFTDYQKNIIRQIGTEDFGISDSLKLKYLWTVLDSDVRVDLEGVYQDIRYAIKNIKDLEPETLLEYLHTSYQSRYQRIKETFAHSPDLSQAENKQVVVYMQKFLSEKLHYKQKIFRSVFEDLKKEMNLRNMLKRYLNEYRKLHQAWIIYLIDSFSQLNGEISGFRSLAKIRGKVIKDLGHARISLIENFPILLLDLYRIYDNPTEAFSSGETILDASREFHPKGLIVDFRHHGIPGENVLEYWETEWAGAIPETDLSFVAIVTDEIFLDLKKASPVQLAFFSDPERAVLWSLIRYQELTGNKIRIV